MSLNPDWYKNAIVYAVDVPVFKDANGDGWGDLQGLIQKLDYLSELGVNCLWVLPIFASPFRDNGYDVVNYMSLNERFGTFDVFDAFIREAHARGIRVILDAVIHHTSDKHPWFQAGRRSKQSRFRDYYVWAEKPPTDSPEQNIFPTVESGVWHYDQVADAYFHHKFYHFQPDLNVRNPRVQEEIRNILDFWLSFGVDGFRIDAATHLLDDKGIPNTGVENPDQFLEGLSNFVRTRNPEAVLVAEADVTPDRVPTYFGQGNRFQLLFNFLISNQLFLALARQDAQPLEAWLHERRDLAANGQWLMFLRNLDELDLEHLSQVEREQVYRAFAPEERMQIYGRGIRRRLAPMMDGNQQRLKMLFSLLFSLPGAPMIAYGDEIGMGDNLSIEGRNGVRIPMQWSSERNGSFSTAAKEKLVRPAMDEGPYRYEKVNVAAQRQDPNSLWRSVQELIAVRKTLPQIGTSKPTVLSGAPAVFGLSYVQDAHELVVWHNFSASPQDVQLPRATTGDWQQRLGDKQYARGRDGKLRLTPFGFGWWER